MVQWVESPAMSLLWHAWELPHALVVAKKKKKVLGLMEFPFYARVTDRQTKACMVCHGIVCYKEK